MNLMTLVQTKATANHRFPHYEPNLSPYLRVTVSLPPPNLKKSYISGT